MEPIYDDFIEEFIQLWKIANVFFMLINTTAIAYNSKPYIFCIQ